MADVNVKHGDIHTMEARDEDHKSSLRKILEDFRRSLRDEFRDSLTEADDQAGSVNMTATDVNTTSYGKVSSRTENQPRVHSASQRAPGNKPTRTKSVLHDPRIMRQIRPLSRDLSVKNGYKQKMTNVDDQSLNSNQKQNMEQLEGQSSNNGDKQKLALDDDHIIKYDPKQNLTSLDGQSLKYDLKQKMPTQDDQSLNNDHKQKMESLDDQSLNNDHKQKTESLDDQSLNNDHTQKMESLDDQSLNNDHKQKMESLDDQSLNNDHTQKMESLDDQSLNNDHKQKMESLDDKSLNNDHKQKMESLDDKSLNNDHKQKMESLDDQSLNNDHKQKMESLDDQSLNNDHKQKMESLDDQSLNNDHKQKMESLDDQSLNNDHKQKTESLDDQSLNDDHKQQLTSLDYQSLNNDQIRTSPPMNNDHEQKTALDDDHMLQYDPKQKMGKPDDQSLTNDHKQIAQLDDQSLHCDHKHKAALVDVQSLHNDHKHEVVLVDDQSLTNDPKQKLTSLDDQSSTDTYDVQTTGDTSIARNSDSDAEENIRKNSVEFFSPVDKTERRYVLDTDYSDDTRLAQRTTPATVVIEDVTSEPRHRRQFNSLCLDNTGTGLDEHHVRLTSSSILSHDENEDVQSEPESREGSVTCKTRPDGTRVDASQLCDHEHAIPDDLTVDGSIMSQTEGGDTIANCPHGSLSESGESSDRQSIDIMGTPESACTPSDDISVYKGNTDMLTISSGRNATPYFTGHVYGDSEDDTTDYGDEQTLEPGRSHFDQDGEKDDMCQGSDSGDQTEQLTASISKHTGQLMPLTDDSSNQKDGLHFKPGNVHSGELSEAPGHLIVEHALMPCMLPDSDSVNSGPSDAQAQARAEQRKNSDVHLKFGSDGLHINTDNAHDNSGHFQPQITPPQHKYSPQLQQLTPLYDPQYDSEQAVGDASYHLNPYPTTYITSLPEFTDPVSTNSYGFPPVFEAGSRKNGRGIEMSQTDNRIIPFRSAENNSNSSPYELGEYEHNDRRRRLGRDHTNYVLPPSSLKLYKDHVTSDNSLGVLGSDHGPPGLPLISDNNIYGEEERLKFVVLDKTDDEDDFSDPSPNESGDHTRLYGSRYTARSHSDVFPIDRRAADRDLYKQVFDPTAGDAKTSRSASVHTFGANHSIINRNPRAANTLFGRSNTEQQEYNYQNNPTSAPGMLIHVTDYDTETGPHTGRTSLRSSALQRHQSPMGHSPNNIVARGHLHEYYGQPYNEIARHSQVNSETRQLYSMSQIDYDRYTSNPSQLSLEPHHDSYTDRSGILHKTHGSGLSGIHPIPEGPTHSNNDHGNHPEARVLGPGYKFQVNKYNVAKRASIVNRAEQLLDSRRGQFTDRSESSDELERIDEDDDEDFDGIDDMNGPRHRALKHLQRRVYDDSTSYNSSDDVLHNMRYPARGPVSQAARRARLTSVNARLKKQKRSRTTRRRQVRPPSPVVSDTDDSSSEDDITEPGSSHKQLHDLSRYEEPNALDPGKGDNLLHPNQSETTPGPVGRRVMFFRNGDIHYRPKQVLINNKTYTNLEKLLVDLSSMVETSTGVKYIFSWPEGREVKSITELENGKYYVCSSTNKLQRVDYGNSKESQWKVGKIDRKDHFLFKQTAKIPSPLRRPRVLTVISNMKRDSHEKLILNTNSQMNFEDILNDISNMINIPNPPVTALYTEKKPHLKVESYSQLMRDFADEDSFIACGEEMVPLELSSRRSGQTSGGRGSKKPPIRNQMYDPQRVQEDPTTARSSEGTNTRDNARVRRRQNDSVRVDINGRTREFFPPKQLEPNDDGQKPVQKLRLTWVYGYRGRDVKQNLAVLSSTGELVYFVAAVAVVYNKKLSSQKHYLGHSEEITCLAVHPNGRFIATGQTAGKTLATGAHVRIWDGVSLSTFSIIGLGTFQQGFSCVNFSEKDVLVKGRMESPAAGDLLMTVDESDRHVLSVWEWQTEKLIARTSTTSEPVVSGFFYASDDNTLITYGKEHIHFWRMFWEKGGKIMRDKLSGNFQDTLPKYVTSICSVPNGDVISGDSSGAILVWTRDNNHVFALNRNISAQTRRAHQKSVSALCMLGDGTLLSGGGNVLKAWDSINNYCLVKERVLPESAGHVRSIVPINMGGLDGSIYVATTRNKVLEGSLQLKFTVIVQGHVEELWAVECHPSEETFVSAGHDQAVIKWSAISHIPVWRLNVENPCTSISIDPMGRLIAVGTTTGRVVILNSSSGVQVTSLMSGTAQINALSFSPDGRQLAVGTFQGLIHIFHVQDDGHSFFRPHASSLKGNGMFIMHLDWSVDSKMIQAAMGDYEVVVWNVTTMQRIRMGSNLRDVTWVSHNSPISHSTIGPWQNLDSGDVINVVCRSQGGDVQVMGDTSGRLRLYKWPCSVAKAGYRQTKVYSSNVTCASFTCDDKYLITSGGNDAALMQFSVIDTVNAR